MLFYVVSFVFLATSLLFRKFLFNLKYILPASEILLFKSSSDFSSKIGSSAKASCEILTGFSCQFPKSKDFESPFTMSSIKIMNGSGLVKPQL